MQLNIHNYHLVSISVAITRHALLQTRATLMRGQAAWPLQRPGLSCTAFPCLHLAGSRSLCRLHLPLLVPCMRSTAHRLHPYTHLRNMDGQGRLSMSKPSHSPCSSTPLSSTITGSTPIMHTISKWFLRCVFKHARGGGEGVRNKRSTSTFKFRKHLRYDSSCSIFKAPLATPPSSLPPKVKQV